MAAPPSRPASDAARTLRLVTLAFAGILAASLVSVFVGVTFYSPVMSAVCVAPWLVGLLVARGLYRRTARRTAETVRLTIDPGPFRVGSVLTGRVDVHVGPRVRARSLEARIWGGEKTDIVQGDATNTVHLQAESKWADTVLSLEPEAGSPAVPAKPSSDPIPPGDYRFRFRYPVSLAAVPTWRGPCAKVRCYVRVTVNLRGLDAVVEEDVPIRPELRRPGRIPGSFQSREVLRIAPAPTLLVSLENQETIPGGHLRGQVTLAGPGIQDVRGLRVRLQERQVARAGGEVDQRDAMLAEVQIPPPVSAGVPVPFQLTVPAQVRPHAQGRISLLSHMVQVTADLPLARDVTAVGEVIVRDAWE